MNVRINSIAAGANIPTAEFIFLTLPLETLFVEINQSDNQLTGMAQAQLSK